MNFSEAMDARTVRARTIPPPEPIVDGAGGQLAAMIVDGTVQIRRYRWDTSEPGCIATDVWSIDEPIEALKLAAEITKVVTDQLAAQMVEDAAEACAR